jgi:G3E family GTPase
LCPVAQGAIDSALLFNIGFYDPTTKGLDVRRWLRDESFEGDHGQDVGHGHEHPDVNRHDDRIRAFCITREQPISWAALSTWLDGLAAMRGDDLLRLKAIVALSDRPDQPVYCMACSTSSIRRCCCPSGRAKTAAHAWSSSPATCRARRSRRFSRV